MGVSTGEVGIGVVVGVVPAARRGQPEALRYAGETHRVRAGRQVVEEIAAGRRAHRRLHHLPVGVQQLDADPASRRLGMGLRAGPVIVPPHRVADREADAAGHHPAAGRRGRVPASARATGFDATPMPHRLAVGADVDRRAQRGERVAGRHRGELGQVGRDLRDDEVPAAGELVGAGQDVPALVVGPARRTLLPPASLTTISMPGCGVVDGAVVGAVAVHVAVDDHGEGAVGRRQRARADCGTSDERAGERDKSC